MLELQLGPTLWWGWESKGRVHLCTLDSCLVSFLFSLIQQANEQQRRFENLLKICRQVNPQLDISFFAKIFSPEEANKEYARHKFCPPDHAITTEVMSHLKSTEVMSHLK